MSADDAAAAVAVVLLVVNEEEEEELAEVDTAQRLVVLVQQLPSVRWVVVVVVLRWYRSRERGPPQPLPRRAAKKKGRAGAVNATTRPLCCILSRICIYVYTPGV
jgi:hypothetical protein